MHKLATLALCLAATASYGATLQQYSGWGVAATVPPSPTDKVLIQQGGVNKSISAANLVAHLPAASSAIATALAGNGTNCSAGSAPRGVDASGNAENCTTYLSPTGSGDGLTFSNAIAADITGNAATATTATVASTVTDPDIPYLSAMNTWTDAQAFGSVTASDMKVGSDAAFAAVAVNLTRTTIDRHAFEDWSHLNTVDTGQGYSSFDAKATMANSSAQSHLVGYQSRNIYNGSANLNDYMHGYDTDMQHTGSGTVTLAAGVKIRDVGGSGPITNNFGVYIDRIVRGGTLNYAIFSDADNVHMLGGPTGTVITGDIQARSLNFGVDTGGKSITYGYGTAGVANFGSHVFYNGKTGIAATIDNAGIVVGGVVSAKSYTLGSLPVTAPAGASAFCSDCRKTSEGEGAGTGIPVYFSNAAWRAYSNDAAAAN